MRKWLSIVLSGLLICSLSGCGQNQKEMTQSETEITSITENSEEENVEHPVVIESNREEEKSESIEETEITSTAETSEEENVEHPVVIESNREEEKSESIEETEITSTAETSEEENVEHPVIIESNKEEEKSDDTENTEDTSMKLYFNETEIPVAWEKCKAVEELMEEAANGDIVVSMSMYGGWEQVGSLGKSYTRDDKQMTAVSGDIVLYSGNQIVVFYGSNSWAYTKLGRMDISQNTIEELLSKGDITLTIRK